MSARARRATSSAASISLMRRAPSSIRGDQRFPYGEERFQLLGRIEQRVFVVVYTPRLRVIRIISARKANQREVKHHENHSHDDQA